jgi:hypothetical protein
VPTAAQAVAVFLEQAKQALILRLRVSDPFDLYPSGGGRHPRHDRAADRETLAEEPEHPVVKGPHRPLPVRG